MTASRTVVRRIVLGASAIVAGLGLAFAVHGADESGPVPKPDVKAGDSWAYRQTVFAGNVSKPVKLEVRVSFVSADAIVTVDRVGDGPENDSQYTSEWNPISLSFGAVFDRPYQMFKFPMRVGDTYPYSYETSWRGSPARSRSEGSSKVVGWEEVVVPAGKFRALKIESRGTFQRLDTRGGSNQRLDLWYVPEIRRFVKSHYEESQPGRDPDVRRVNELMEFRIQ